MGLIAASPPLEVTVTPHAASNLHASIVVFAYAAAHRNTKFSGDYSFKPVAVASGEAVTVPLLVGRNKVIVRVIAGDLILSLIHI